MSSNKTPLSSGIRSGTTTPLRPKLGAILPGKRILLPKGGKGKKSTYANK